MSSLPRQPLGKAALGHEIRGLEARRDRLAPAAGDGVEPRHGLRPEARGERRARPRQEIAERAQPGALHAAARRPRRGAARRPAGARRSPRSPPAASRPAHGARPGGSAPAPAPEPGPGASAPRAAKPWAARRRSTSASRAASPPNKCAAPVTSMSDAVRRIGRGERREAPAPIGDRREQSGVGRRIGRGEPQRRAHGAGVGDRHAGDEPGPLGARVDGGQALAALAFRRRRRRARPSSERSRASREKSGRSKGAAGTWRGNA